MLKETFGDDLSGLTWEELQKYPELANGIGNALEDFMDDIVDGKENLYHAEEMRILLEQLFPDSISGARETEKPWHNVTLEEQQKISLMISQGSNFEKAWDQIMVDRKKKGDENMTNGIPGIPPIEPISPGGEMAGIREYQPTDDWRKIHEISRKLGFDTALELVSKLMRDPQWMPEQVDPSMLGTEDFQAFLDMREAVQEWDPIISEIGGWGIIIGTSGWSDIFVKYATGNIDQINAGDLASAALDTAGAVGFGKLLTALKKVPKIGSKFGGAIDDLVKGATRWGRWGKESIKTFDDVDKMINRAGGVADNLNISLEEALRLILDEDALIKARKIAFDAGKKETVGMLDDALRVGKEAFEEAFEETAERVFKEGAEEVFESIPRDSVKAAEKFLRDNGYSDDFIKQFLSEVKTQRALKGLPQSINDAFRTVSGQTPNRGITPMVLKKFKFRHPTVSKLTKLIGGGAGIGTGYLGLKGLQEAAFGGFMFEEAEQMTMFAQFFTADDIQALARTIAYTSLPVWDMAENWAQSVGEPVQGLASTVLGEGVGRSIFTGPALGTHESFTRALIDKLTNLQEKGSWTGLEADLMSGTVTNWGRPTSQEEIGLFLNANPEYYQYYEKEMEKLAREDPGLLYQLYYEGMADWYTDLPGWMREQITQYQEDLKTWRYQAQRGQLSGQDALSMAKAIEGTIWYDQADKNILNDAVQAGNLVYTMMESGKISQAQGMAFLTGLEAKLKNNNHTKGMLSLGDNGKIQWAALTPEQMAESFGSVDIIANQPQLVLTPPGTTLRSTALTPYLSGERTGITEVAASNRRQIEATTGMTMPRVPVTLKGEVAEREKLIREEAAATMPTEEGIRGVGFVPTAATPEERAAMAKVPSDVGAPIEGLTTTESRWVNGIREGTTDWATLQRLNPEVYNSLKQKGIGPGTELPEAAPTTVEKLFPQITGDAAARYTGAKQAEIERERIYEPRGGLTGGEWGKAGMQLEDMNKFFEAIEGDTEAMEDLGLVWIEPTQPGQVGVWGRKKVTTPVR